MEGQGLNSELIGTDSGYVVDIRSDESNFARVDPPCFDCLNPDARYIFVRVPLVILVASTRCLRSLCP